MEKEDLKIKESSLIRRLENDRRKNKLNTTRFFMLIIIVGCIALSLIYLSTGSDNYGLFFLGISVILMFLYPNKKLRKIIGD